MKLNLLLVGLMVMSIQYQIMLSWLRLLSMTPVTCLQLMPARRLFTSSSCMCHHFSQSPFGKICRSCIKWRHFVLVTSLLSSVLLWYVKQ